MLHSEANGVLRHHCEICYEIRPQPVTAADCYVTEHIIGIICPCGAVEGWNHDTVAYYARLLDEHATESLVGTRLDGGNVVVEDSRHSVPPHTAQQIRHALRLHADPVIRAKRKAACAAARMTDPLP